MRKRRLALRALLACAAVLAGLFLGGYAWFAQVVTARNEVPPRPADAIVALTGGSNRIGDAIDLLQSRHGKRLLISGVNERTGRDELGRLNPAGRSLLACCVDLDHRARNTIGNAIEARRWAKANGFDSLVVVTSNYHLPRTMLEFRHAMPQVRLIGHPVANEMTTTRHWWHDPAAARLIAVEYTKYLAAWLRSRIEADPETAPIWLLSGGRKPVAPKAQSVRDDRDSLSEPALASSRVARIRS